MYFTRDSFIFVTFEFEGFHAYENAPPEVSYLRNEHRHMFQVKVQIEVFHDDRDIEFHMFKNFVQELPERHDMNNKSCEMIGDVLFHLIAKKYPKRSISIQVSEDGENGSFTMYDYKFFKENQ